MRGGSALESSKMRRVKHNMIVHNSRKHNEDRQQVS
jgi:hypothetical protein